MYKIKIFREHTTATGTPTGLQTKVNEFLVKLDKAHHGISPPRPRITMTSVGDSRGYICHTILITYEVPALGWEE